MTTYATPDGRVARPVAPAHLPDSSHLETTDPREVSAYLRHLEQVRRQQLDDLPATSLDPVVVAHRASVERILEEVTVALRRLDEGRYGTCAGCGDAISTERLRLRPWATTCTRCVRRDRG